MPVKFNYSCPHIKAVCGWCGFYIKFVHAIVVPNFLESKNKIWAVTNDLKLIEEAKAKVGVHKDLKGIDKNIAYHNLYTYIIKNNFI